MEGAHPTPANPGLQPDRSEDVVTTMDIHKVLSLLPHRYPFLLIDKVLDYKVNESLRALKNVSYNEPYFVGHFPVRPVMPGVLIVEALAQATGLLAMASRPDEVGEARRVATVASVARRVLRDQVELAAARQRGKLLPEFHGFLQAKILCRKHVGTCKCKN